MAKKKKNERNAGRKPMFKKFKATQVQVSVPLEHKDEAKKLINNLMQQTYNLIKKTMIDLSKYNVEELTDAQKKKVDRVIKLLVELQKEKVNACVASTPQNKLIFYKADKWLDSMQEIQDMHNQTDYVYEGKNQPDSLIDAVGY